MSTNKIKRSSVSMLLVGASLTFAASTADAFQVVNVAKGQASLTGMLYVWDANIPGDTLQTVKLLQYAVSQGFDTLAIEASPVGYGIDGSVERYDEFIQAAHGTGLNVHALIGYSWFSVPDNAGLPGQPTGQGEGWSLVQGIAGSDLFDGIVDDSQPGEVVYWDDNGVSHNWLWEDTEYAAQSYLDWLHGVKMYAGDLPLIAATPSWYDADSRLTSMYLNGSDQARDFASYVAEETDVVNVLAYRDEISGANGIIEIVSGEIAYGPVLIGVETRDLGPQLDYLTFFEEGLVEMQLALTKTWKAYKKDEHLAGFSVHHYGSMSLLKSPDPLGKKSKGPKVKEKLERKGKKAKKGKGKKAKKDRRARR